MQKPFFVWQNKVLKRIHPEDVMCLFTVKNYTKIFLANKSTYVVRTSLSKTLQKLPPDMFIKTHRSFAVSVYFIDNVARDHLTVAGKTIPIGRQFYRIVMEELNVIE